MLTGVVNAMSSDMSNKLSSHFKSLEAHFTPAEARVQQNREVQGAAHGASRANESQREATYYATLAANRTAHNERIKHTGTLITLEELRARTKKKTRVL
jgi:outer membrane murein-binding lipoprotein Lpp